MFLNDFSEYLSTLLPTQNKLFVVGDFNFHVNIPDDPDTIKLQDLLETFNMTQFVKEPTHISGNTLDFVLTRTSDNLVHSIQVGSQFSDHFAVHCKLNLQKPGYAKNLVTYRKLKAINRTDFECDIENSELITSPKPDLTGLINQYNETLHYDNLSLKITLKNYSYSENCYYKRKCCTVNFSVLFQCNFQRCLCLTWWEQFKIGFSHNNSKPNRIIIGFKFSMWL